MNVVDLGKMLPYDLQPGERVLWFGRPDPVSLWRRAYRAEIFGLYIAVMAAWVLVSETSSGGAAAGVLGAGKTLAAGAIGLAILGFLAWLSARTTLFVVTTRRLVLKVGIALPIFYNVPFAQIAGATLRLDSDGTGDVSVALTKGQRIAYLTLWPAARPGRFARPEPTLRCIPNAREVATALGAALREAAGDSSAARPVAAPSRERAFSAPALEGAR
jgi:hypothetical protein